MEQFFEFIANHPFLAGAFVLLLALFVRNEMRRGGQTVTAQQLVDLINREGAVVVDVRDKKEFREGHIVDSLNIPHTVLGDRLRELEKHRQKAARDRVQMGQHSGAAGTMLRKAGFDKRRPPARRADGVARSEPAGGQGVRSAPTPRSGTRRS